MPRVRERAHALQWSARMRIPAAMAVAVSAPILVLLAGCSDPFALPQAEDCPTTFEEDFPEKRAVEIGLGEGESFVPFADGDIAKLETGGQGATMVAPMVRVAAGASDGSEECYRVRLADDTDQGPDGPNTSQNNVVFVRAGEWMVSDGTVYHPFNVSDPGDLYEAQIALTATVQGDGFEGTTTVNVTLQ